MKASLSLSLFLLPLVLFSSEIRIGDNVDAVQDALGAPRGRAQSGTRELLCFDRGEVELVGGVVTRVALRSEEAQVAYEMKRSADDNRARTEQANRLIRLTAEGEALKASKVADVQFQSAPPRYQVDFWMSFVSRYPNVPCTEQLAIARAKFYQQDEIERARAKDARRADEIAANEQDSKIFYPIIPSPYGFYSNGWRERQRMERLDRDYRRRVIYGQDHVRTDLSYDDERGQRTPARNYTRNHGHNFLSGDRDEAKAKRSRNSGGRQSGVSGADSLVVPGQNVMAWDGTRLPGGEPAGLYR